MPIEPEADDIETTDAPPSLRETLEAAFDDSAPEPTGAAPTDVEAAPEETEAEAAQRARDEAGRFAKEAKKPAAVVKPTPKAVAPAVVKPAPLVVKPGTVPTPGQPAVPEMKAPQAWRGPAKEVWGQLPEAARVEVLRREKEIATQLGTAAEDRKYAQTLRETFRPYEAQIRAEGSTPEKAIGNLLNTAMALRTAPPAHKARLVAEIITGYGVPLEGLVAALSGQQVPEGQPQRQAPQQVDPEAIAARVEKQLLERLGSQREAQLVTKYTQETEAFLEKQPMHGPDGTDYGQDIREDMADIIERAARRGSTITLEKAYSLAARQHPEVSKVLATQERAAAAAKASASTQRARAATVSVRSQPATVPVVKGSGSSLRETLEAAFDSASGG
jgi:hypothetical protein